ncbi:alpha/beta hydrolase fold-domain-containing protein [Obelidium mucronatum]|nr:alpha/beta hydrolase fold-domain-containing protein [Obelidium mucronatum]
MLAQVREALINAVYDFIVEYGREILMALAVVVVSLAIYNRHHLAFARYAVFSVVVKTPLIFLTRSSGQVDSVTAAFVSGIRSFYAKSNLAAYKTQLKSSSWLQGVAARSAYGLLVAPVESSDGESVPRGFWVAESFADFPSETRPKVPSNSVVLLYVHGGGYAANTAEAYAHHHIKLITEFNKLEADNESKKRLIVFSVSYPLAPKSPYPAALDAVTEAYHWLTEKVNAKTVLIGGDEAGAHCVIQFLNSVKGKKPIASILISPWVDPANTSTRTKASSGDFVNVDLSLVCADAFRGSFAKNDPEINLLRLKSGDIHLAEKTLVIYGGAEVYASGIAQFIETIQKKEGESGVEVHVGKGMCHNFNLIRFPSFGVARKRQNEAIQKTVDFIQSVV